MAGTNRLHNALADMLVVIGIDENTGLKKSNQQFDLDQSVPYHESNLYGTAYDAHVLAALTDSCAMFPQSVMKVDPMYPPTEMCVTSLEVQSPDDTLGSKPLSRRRSTRRFSSMIPDTLIRRRSSGRRRSSAQRRLSTKGQGQAQTISTEMVNSLTTFCFPDGARVYDQRPDERAHYLVLTEMSGANSYATCLTIYLQYWAQQSPGGDHECEYVLHTSEEEEEDEDSEEALLRTRCHIPLCLVLISRQPYFSVMKDCLSSIVSKMYQNMGKPMHLRDLAIRLTMTPTPPAGSLELSAELFGCPVRLPPPSFPGKDVVDLPFSVLFNCFSLDAILRIMAAVMTSQRIVFLAEDYALLTLISQSILYLVLPFRWRVTYVPVLPRSLLELVEAPGTYILGCHSRHQQLVDEVDGIIVVNIDTGKVRATSPDLILPRLPPLPSRKFKDACRSAKRQYDVIAHVTVSSVSAPEEQQKAKARGRHFNAEVAAAALELMVDLFSVVMPFLRLNMNVFNKQAFFNSLPSECRPFYESVLSTDMFSVFLRDRFKGKRDYWNQLYEKTRPAARTASVDSAESRPEVSTFPNTRRSRTSSCLLQFFNEPELTSFHLPAYVKTSKRFSSTLGLPGHGKKGDHFYDRCVQELTFQLQEARSPSLRGSYLYLRGLLHVASGRAVDGLEDLHNLASTDNRLFPTEIVKEILSSMSQADLDRLRQTNFYKTSAHLSSLSVPRLVDESDDIITEFSVLPEHDVGFSDFCQRVQLAELATDHDTLVRLYEALTISKGPAGLFEATVDPLTFLQFYECWKETDDQCQYMTDLLGDKKLEEEEVVLKVSPLIKTDQGTGRIVLTSKRLFMVQNDVIKKLMRLRSIQRVVRVKQTSFFSTIGALKIFHRSPDRFPLVLCLKQDCDLWLTLITEIWSGVLAADRSRDPEMTSQAQTNVILADAVYNSGQESECAHHQHVSEAVRKMCYFSQHFRRDSSSSTDVLLQTINASSQEPRKTPVEALLYTPPFVSSDVERGQLLWCGLGNGKIKVYDVGSWKLVSDTLAAKDRVVCLAEVGNRQVWAGSFDSAIYIVDIQTRTCHQTLLDHGDIVSDLLTLHDGKEVYSASLNGTVIVWNTEDLTKKHRIHVSGFTLRSICVNHNVLWLGGREELLCMPQSVYHKQADVTVDTLDDRLARLQHTVAGSAVEMTRFIVRFDEIWTISSRSNEVMIWDRASMTRLMTVSVDDCRGLTEMKATDTKVWLGTKCGTIRIVDGERRTVVKSLIEAHTDSVRSMCVTPNGVVMVGGGGGDGKVTVWSSMAEESAQ